MRRYLLDTSAVAALLHARTPAVSLMRPWTSAHEAATSMVVYGEVTGYILGHPDAPAFRRGLRDLLGEIKPLALSYAILERYASLRRQLRPPYGPGLIGDVDTLIAATALEYGLTLVTGDRDFERVPALDLMLLPPMR